MELLRTNTINILGYLGNYVAQGYGVYSSGGISGTLDCSHIACGCGQYYLVIIDETEN